MLGLPPENWFIGAVHTCFSKSIRVTGLCFPEYLLRKLSDCFTARFIRKLLNLRYVHGSCLVVKSEIKL